LAKHAEDHRRLGEAAMLTLEFARTREAPLRILCLGAHADDIEIGCGGAVLELTRRHPDASVHWIVFSARGPRREEAARSAEHFLKAAGEKRVLLREFRDGFFPYVGAEIKAFFEEIKGGPAPDLVFTHQRNDLHQDHRLICELTWNTFRDQLILEYEIPKYDADLGTPNLFVPLAAGCREEKLRGILEGFPSQLSKHWFTRETFEALLRLRGVESRSPTGYAEAFYARKAVLETSEGFD
jgi:LmbE family N-acetylglucosaminyl deacetylase